MCLTSLDDRDLYSIIKGACKLLEFSKSYVTAHRNEKEGIVSIDSAMFRRQCKTGSKKMLE